MIGIVVQILKGRQSWKTSWKMREELMGESWERATLFHQLGCGAMGAAAFNKSKRPATAPPFLVCDSKALNGVAC